MNQQLQKERQSLLNIIIKSSTQFKAKQKMTLLLACSLWILYSIPKLLWRSPDNGGSWWNTFVSKVWNTLKAAGEFFFCFFWGGMLYVSPVWNRGWTNLCVTENLLGLVLQVAVWDMGDSDLTRRKEKKKTLWAQTASAHQHKAVCIWRRRDRILLSCWNEGLQCETFPHTLQVKHCRLH